jgi:hypothetical protein
MFSYSGDLSAATCWGMRQSTIRYRAYASFHYYNPLREIKDGPSYLVVPGRARCQGRAAKGEVAGC